MKGRKTHVQTIYAMDTATYRACSDRDVFCFVAYDGQSCGGANDYASHCNISCTEAKYALAPLTI
jgi:hypothetical protein